MTPPRSPIFINPIHSDRMPVSPSEISKAVAADENDALIIELQKESDPNVVKCHCKSFYKFNVNFPYFGITLIFSEMPSKRANIA